MAFPPNIAEQALLDCGRHCCICHKFCGFKIELHHIVQQSEGGEDSYENCIPLCLDCHAEVKAYDPKHPKGRKYTNTELHGHRDKWYAKVKNSYGIVANPDYVEIDRVTYRRMIEILPIKGSLDFVRQHTYARPFPGDAHNDLKKFLVESQYPDFEFLDAELESHKASLKESIESFISLILSTTFEVDNNPALMRVPIEWKMRAHERWDDAIWNLDRSASNLIRSYDEFIRLARRKLLT